MSGMNTFTSSSSPVSSVLRSRRIRPGGLFLKSYERDPNTKDSHDIAVYEQKIILFLNHFHSYNRIRICVPQIVCLGTIYPICRYII